MSQTPLNWPPHNIITVYRVTVTDGAILVISLICVIIPSSLYPIFSHSSLSSSTTVKVSLPFFFFFSCRLSLILPSLLPFQLLSFHTICPHFSVSTSLQCFLITFPFPVILLVFLSSFSSCRFSALFPFSLFPLFLVSHDSTLRFP